MKHFFAGRFAAVSAVIFLFLGCAGPEVVKEEITETAVSQETPAEVRPEAADTTAEEPPKDMTVTTIPEETVLPGEADKEAAAERQAEPAAQPEETARPAAPEKIEFYTVYFDYDEYAVRDTDKANLIKDAEMLKASPGLKAVIEGHADERGETEYNLALGDKRAKSVERYLKTLGINPVRLSTISYGEERPAVSGHDEEAWAKNRRVEFKAAE